jgi:site-specific DNA recombinase
MGRPHDSSDLTPTENWTLVATIPALVSQEQFDLVQTKLSHNQAFAKRNNKTHQYLLRALVSCGKCRYSCVGRKNGRHGYYVCSSKDKGLRAAGTTRAAHADGCPSRHIPAQQLDDLVWQDVCDVILHPNSLIEALERAHGGHWLPQELQARRENLRKARQQIAQQIERLTDAYVRSVIPLAEFERRRGELEQKDQALARQDEQLSREAVNHESLLIPAAGIDEFCKRIQVGLHQASFEQKRRLVELLIDRVIVDGEQVEIHYAIPTAPAGETARFCHLRMAYFAHPLGVWLIGRELTIQHIRCWSLAGISRRGHHKPLPFSRIQLAFGHQPTNAATPMPPSKLTQAITHPRAAIRLAMLVELRLDDLAQLRIFLDATPRHVLLPFVVAAARHAQVAAQPVHGQIVSTTVDEAVFHFGIAAKNSRPS